MIPSDHFVRFYNELFKFLETLPSGEMQAYYRSVSEHQEMHTLALFKEKGLKGMYEYWSHIRFEENCELEMELHEDCLVKHMKKCPSLTKVLDNDASPCYSYCNHCPGWILPLMTKAGVFAVYNLIDRRTPRCEMFVYLTKDEAESKRAELTAKYGSDVILTNY